MLWKVAAFYRFIPLADLPALRETVTALCAQNRICGTILLAPEGVNSTISAAPADLDAVIDALDRLMGIRQGELKFSSAPDQPFKRMKVRLKKEIITMKAPEADAANNAGAYVSAQEWNNLLADPEVLLLDTRNDYETEVGIFKGAVDPKINTFTQFKDYVQKHLDPQKHKKVAMYCTGGIRCEKASAYMRAHGFEQVYHLKGGILKYLEDIPQDQSLWEGKCFVFDERDGIGHGLTTIKGRIR